MPTLPPFHTRAAQKGGVKGVERVLPPPQDRTRQRWWETAMNETPARHAQMQRQCAQANSAVRNADVEAKRQC